MYTAYDKSATTPSLNFKQVIKRFPGFRRNFAQEYYSLYQGYGNRLIIPNPLSQKKFRLVVFDPADLEYVFKTNHENFEKGSDNFVLKYFLGSGLLSNNGETWSKHRKEFGKMFKSEDLERFSVIIQEQTDALISLWSNPNHKINLYHDISTISICIMGKFLFGDCFTEFAEEMNHLLHKAVFAIRRDWPTLIKPLSRSIKNKLQKNMYVLLHKSEHRPIINLSTEECVDEFLTLLFAGMDTTTNALVFTLYLLAKNIDKQEFLRNMLGDDKLIYLDCVIKESLRLYPPVPVFSRVVKKKDRIGNQTVYPGTIVDMAPYVTHRKEEYYINPLVFNPDRFKCEGESPFCYFPFGLGPRRCIGEYFAKKEMELMLNKLIKNFEFSTIEQTVLNLRTDITLRPQMDLQLMIKNI